MMLSWKRCTLPTTRREYDGRAARPTQKAKVVGVWSFYEASSPLLPGF
jgi:hypothetical protein